MTSSSWPIESLRDADSGNQGGSGNQGSGNGSNGGNQAGKPAGDKAQGSKKNGSAIPIPATRRRRPS